MQQLEESKNEEMQRMRYPSYHVSLSHTPLFNLYISNRVSWYRDEMQQYVAHKEHEQKQKCDEIIGEMQEQMRQGKAELDRLNQENAVLKHGIRIQVFKKHMSYIIYQLISNIMYHLVYYSKLR